MKTHGWAAIALAAVLLAVSVPASADFHPDCLGFATAYANTDLTAVQGEQGTELRYAGVVNCPGAYLAITHLEIAPEGGDALATTEGEACDLSPCETSDTVPAPAEGTYRVNMTFTAGSYERVDRAQWFHWPGAGQPVPVCVHVGFFPAKAGDCPGGLLG